MERANITELTVALQKQQEMLLKKMENERKEMIENKLKALNMMQEKQQLQEINQTNQTLGLPLAQWDQQKEMGLNQKEMELKRQFPKDMVELEKNKYLLEHQNELLKNLPMALVEQQEKEIRQRQELEEKRRDERKRDEKELEEKRHQQERDAKEEEKQTEAIEKVAAPAITTLATIEAMKQNLNEEQKQMIQQTAKENLNQTAKEMQKEVEDKHKEEVSRHRINDLQEVVLSNGEQKDANYLQHAGMIDGAKSNMTNDELQTIGKVSDAINFDDKKQVLPTMGDPKYLTIDDFGAVDNRISVNTTDPVFEGEEQDVYMNSNGDLVTTGGEVIQEDFDLANGDETRFQTDNQTDTHDEEEEIEDNYIEDMLLGENKHNQF